jgi:hypothetical protein
VRPRLNIRLFAAAAFMATTVAGTDGHAANTSVDVTVRGMVPNLCEIRSPSSSNNGSNITAELPAAAGAAFGALSAAGTAAFGFTMSCNSKFQVSLQSQNGGLKHIGPAPLGASDFTTSVPYRVGWEVGLDGGGSAKVDGCLSQDLLDAGGCTASTTDSAISKSLTAKVSWDGTPASAPPLSGNFRDVMTIRLTATGW